MNVNGHTEAQNTTESGMRYQIFSCFLTGRWEDLCFFCHGLTPLHPVSCPSRSILYLPGPWESCRPFLPFCITSKPTKLFAMDSFIPFILPSKGEKKSKVGLLCKKGENAWNFILPLAVLSLCAAFTAYLLSTSRISVLGKRPVCHSAWGRRSTQ